MTTIPAQPSNSDLGVPESMPDLLKIDPATAIRYERQVSTFPYKEGDLLELMFMGQKGLMDKYHAIEAANGSPVIREAEEGDLDNRKVQARLHELFGYMVREMSEAMQELKLKPWKRTEIATDTRAFVNECGDAAHFFFEFLITAGISPIDLYEAYFRMHKKNADRQDNGY